MVIAVGTLVGGLGQLPIQWPPLGAKDTAIDRRSTHAIQGCGACCS